MSDDKVENGAYINNPEFPFKNLNIEKIEKIRKSTSLNNKVDSQRDKSNEDSEKKENSFKQRNIQKFQSLLNKKISKSKNFIEKNIEKISSFSKKNDMFIKSKKPCNRKHIIGYDLHKDDKKDLKDKTLIEKKSLKNRNIANDIKNKNLIFVKNKNTVIDTKNKNAENDIKKNFLYKKDDNIEDNKKKVKKYSYLNFERSKSLKIKNQDIKNTTNNMNSILKKHKSFLNEDMFNKNYKNKINSYEINKKYLEYNKNVTYLKKYNKSVQEKKNELNNMLCNKNEIANKNNLEAFENKLKKNLFNNNKLINESNISNYKPENTIEEEKFKESSNLITSYNEKNKVKKKSFNEIENEFKELDILENKNQKELYDEQRYNKNVNSLSCDSVSNKYGNKYIKENEDSCIKYKKDSYDNYYNKSEVYKTEKKDRLYNNNIFNSSSLTSNSDIYVDKKEVLDKSISLNDNLSIDTMNNYNLTNNKECKIINEKIRHDNRMSNDNKSFSYDIEEFNNKTDQIITSDNKHLENFHKKVDEKRFPDQIYLKKFSENINKIRSFDQLLSEKFSDITDKIDSSNHILLNSFQRNSNNYITEKVRDKSLISSHSNAVSDDFDLKERSISNNYSTEFENKIASPKNVEESKKDSSIKNMNETYKLFEDNFSLKQNYFKSNIKESKNEFDEFESKYIEKKHSDEMNEHINHIEMLNKENERNKSDINNEEVYNLSKLNNNCNENIKTVGSTYLENYQNTFNSSKINYNMKKYNRFKNENEETNFLNEKMFNKEYINSKCYEDPHTRNSENIEDIDKIHVSKNNYIQETNKERYEEQKENEGEKKERNDKNRSEEIEEKEKDEREKKEVKKRTGEIEEKGKELRYDENFQSEDQKEKKYDEDTEDYNRRKKQDYEEKEYIVEFNDKYFDRSKKSNISNKKSSYRSIENSQKENSLSLELKEDFERKNKSKVLDEFKHLSNSSYSYQNDKSKNEYNSENNEMKLNNLEEDKNKILYSSNDTYNTEIVKIYSKQLSKENSNKKQNKIINKKMILKEIFGSNYESSLKNNLNESSNKLEDENEEEERKEVEVEVEEEEEEEEEEEREEVEEEEEEERKEVEVEEEEEEEEKERKEVEEEEEEEEKEEEEEEEEKEEEREKVEEEEERENVEEEEEREEVEKEEEREEVEEEEVEGEEVEGGREKIYIHKKVEENYNKLGDEKPKRKQEENTESEEENEEYKYEKKKEEIGSSQNIENNENKYNLFINDKSFSKEISECSKSSFNKTKDIDKNMYVSELENDEDSLIKRYEENSSPLILSKPFFNNGNSESSFSRSVIKGGKNEFLNLKNNNFLDKTEIKDLKNISKDIETKNVGDYLCEYQDDEYISKKYSILSLKKNESRYKNNRENIIEVKENKEEVSEEEISEEKVIKKINEEEVNEENFIGKVNEEEINEEVVNMGVKEQEEQKEENLKKKKIMYENESQKYDHNFVNEYKPEYLVINKENENIKSKKKEGIKKYNKMEAEKNSKFYTYEKPTDKKEKKSSCADINSNQLEICEEERKNINNLNDDNNEMNNKKKYIISKYMDKKFLIYKDKLFHEKNGEVNDKRMLYLNHESLHNYDDKFNNNKENGYLYESIDENYNCLIKEKSAKNNNYIDLYENVKNHIMLNNNKDIKNNVENRKEDNYYFDYIKYNCKYYDDKYNEEKIDENEYKSNKRKRKNIFEQSSVIENKNYNKFDMHHKKNEYFEGINKKTKKIENMNNSNISYDYSESSKALLFHSINETTNSSNTVVSKRSKYILKQSNFSSNYDDIPMFFNFVNCSSIVLGSEIIYVTDETYGKCENILKDKPFNTNLEKGYYEDISNDLYSVLNNNLSAIVNNGKYNEINRKEDNESILGDPFLNFNENNFGSFNNKLTPLNYECPGWLTKRRIKKYFDFCVIKLCKPTLIKGIDIDTNNFLGNYAPYVSIEGAYIEDDILMDSCSFSKYVNKIKYEYKKRNDLVFGNDFFHKKNDENDKKLNQNVHEMNDNFSDKIRNNLLSNKEEVEIRIDGKIYFKRNKYFYEPILVNIADKMDQEYEKYIEILRHNDEFKNIQSNPKSNSFVTNGNEYRYIDNKLYTLVDVTREIVNKYPDIHINILKNPFFYLDKNKIKDIKNYKNDCKINGNNNDYINKIKSNDNKNNEKKEKVESIEDDDFSFINNSYNSNALFLDNDYSIEKKIYNDLHKKYQWISILEDERMNPGYKNYNHNCFNINTCNKIFTHLIVCLLPDGGINKLRVYGEIKISDKERKKNFKKTINVCNILDGSNIVYTTDEFYGKSENILIDQNSNYVMGWQTRRLINRPLRYIENLTLNNISSIFSNNNYCIIKLSFITNIKYIEINTIFYEYNFPLCVSIDSCYLKEVHSEEKSKQIKFFNENIQNIQWKELLPLSYIKGNHINFFTINKTINKIPSNDIISSHLRLNIYPDGGINTIKAYGTVLEI
ncbi:conserved Plasmodium protein, unknown function [Plasmodium relictum]|uniref:Allantoicase domain-containing protein n=1 Tax=Plasmodium relictum TaxID=85471 RepID=A0A1J1HH69_PLARL|nr:conserved Plasmodium protein, unknown function [Plasmodium relictum]CRH03149.1 conserved Plasmodium protein, unknown function [Plasmodium relictum]